MGKTYTAEELRAVIEAHDKWLRGEAGGSRANLASADLADANLANAIGWLPLAPVVPDLDRRMAEVTSNPDTFDMSTWHCGTTHCRAGWAITLAGEAGRVLEACVGPSVAGALIYVRNTGRPAPDFGCSNEEALADIAACAANPGKPIEEVK